MNLSDILFIGGDPAWGSVQIRVLQIAPRLGVAYICPAPKVDDIPRYYKVFVLVKSGYSPVDLEKLSKRGLVIWDVIDVEPPDCPFINIYMVSSKYVAGHLLGRDGQVVVMPYHHCNIDWLSSTPSSGLVYIGNKRWCPTSEEVGGLDFERQYTDRVDSQSIIGFYLNAGILLNLRHDQESKANHIKWGTTVKLINSIGFGLASICGDEPAYMEINELAGGGCAAFVSTAGQVHTAAELLKSDTVRAEMQSKCLKASTLWHISNIIPEYLKFFSHL